MYSKEKSMKFNDDVVCFAIKDIPVIGNLSTGSIIGLDQNGKEFVDRIVEGRENFDSLSGEEQVLFDALTENKFFTKEPEQDVSIASAYFHVTQKCNLNCLGCYSLDDSRNKSSDSSLEDLKKGLSELKKNGLQILIISGGEPFIRSDLSEILKFAKEELKILQVDLITNGTLVSREKALAIKDYVDTIAVSIDGYDQENPRFIRDANIFDKVKDSVKIIKDAGIPVSILPTVHSKNIDKLDKYVDYANELGVEVSFSILTCSPEDIEFKDHIPTSEQLSALGRQLTELGKDRGVTFLDTPMDLNIDVRKSCEVCNKIVSVGFDGNVYPCHMLHDDELILGNIFNEELETILKRSKAAEIRNIDVREFEVCGECEHMFLCGGGCRARSFYKNRNFISHDYYCSMTKEYFDIVTDMLLDMVAAEA